MTTTKTEQSRVDDFNTAYGSCTWVRYWTGTREDAAKYGLTDGKAWLLGEHTAVVRVQGQSSCIALTHVDVIPGQPDDIEDDTTDIPEPGRAAERVRDYIAANGDGIYDVIDGHPLYARDLESLRRAGEQVEQLTADIDERDSEISMLRHDLDFQTKAAWDNRSKIEQLTAELEKVRAQLTDANRALDGYKADERSLTAANTALANERDATRAVVDAAKRWVESWDGLKGDDTVPFKLAVTSASLAATVRALPVEAVAR